jgi:hypothetical protein
VLVLLDNAALRDDYDRRVQQAEHAGWQRVERAITEFLQILQAMRQRTPEKKDQAGNTTETRPGAEAEAKPQPQWTKRQDRIPFIKAVVSCRSPHEL